MKTGRRGTKVTHSLFTPAERRNWGWWDGRADAQRGKMPLWNKAAVYRCRHPFDQVYGEAYWAGWYGDDHPNRSLPKFNPTDVDAALARWPEAA